MKESIVERALVKAVKKMGGQCRKVQFIGHRGAPDRLVLLNGRAVWVELKAPSERAKLHQLREHAKLREAGQQVVVIDSLEKIEELLCAN